MRRFLRFPGILLILAPLILYAPVLFSGGAIYFGTPSLQFHPWRVYAWKSLLAGDLPLWNALSGMGAPLLANYQSGFLYPPNWLYLLLALFGQPAMAWGQGLLVVLHLVFAALGMARLARWLDLGKLSQVVGGLAFGLSGYLVARAHFLSINAALAWLPWVLFLAGDLVLRKLARLPGKRRFLQLTFAAAMLLLAGHAQSAWYILLLAAAWALYWAWRSRSAHPGRVEDSKLIQDDAHSQLLVESAGELGSGSQAARGPTSAVTAAVGALWAPFLALLAALGLAAAQLIPTAELLLQSQRAGGADLDFVMTYSFWPWRFLGLLMPGFFGNPASGNYWGYGNFWEDAVYIGLLPFFLALAAVWKHRDRALIRFLLGVTLVSFLLALGKNTPVFPFLYRYVPTFDLFQAPTRFSIWAVFALSLLASMGVDTWQAPVDERQQARTGLWIPAALAVALGGFAARIAAPFLDPSFSSAAILAGLLGAAAGLLGWFRQRGPWWPWAVAGLVALDLLIAGWGLNPRIVLDFYEPAPLPVASILNTLQGRRLYMSADDEYKLTFSRYFEFKGFAGGGPTYARALRASLLPNLNLLEDLDSANNFDPLLIGRYARWMDFLQEADPETRDWMLAQMSVGLTSVYDPETEAGVRFQPFQGGGRVAWFPCAVPASSPENAWDRLFESTDVADGFLVLENFSTNAAWVCGDERGPEASGHAELSKAASGELEVRVEAESAGWLLVRDTYYPGWHARVNAAPAKIYPANTLFRAIPVPAGESEVELYYRPGSFYLGLAISAVSSIGLAVFVFLSGRRSNSSEQPE